MVKGNKSAWKFVIEILLRLEGKDDDIVDGGLKSLIKHFAKEQLQKDLPTLSSDVKNNKKLYLLQARKMHPAKKQPVKLHFLYLLQAEKLQLSPYHQNILLRKTKKHPLKLHPIKRRKKCTIKWTRCI